YQFLISKTVTLDLFFFGLEAGLGNVDGSVHSADPGKVAEIRDNIQEGIDDIPSMWGDKIDVTSSGNDVKIEGKSLFTPLYRGGFSLGVAF
ncbi:MAG TPA: hypothetical protein VLM43_12590, partial [Desulfobacterales bacterium]|nr:hypothetical protein [Desulfobacterales bacterium]